MVTTFQALAVVALADLRQGRPLPWWWLWLTTPQFSLVPTLAGGRIVLPRSTGGR